MERPSSSQDPRVPHLVALTGPSVGTAYRLTKPEIIVGREGADICLEQEGVSRRHARLLVTGEQVLVEDLGSTNGTFIGVDRVKRPTVVKDGENIAFGTFAQFRFTHVEPIGGSLVRTPERSDPEDSSVKVGTREYLLDLLGAEYAYARRHHSPLTLVFFRADAVVSVGDSQGRDKHSQDLLGQVATAIDIAIRMEDFLARSGEDEFGVLVRGDVEAAYAMAERVRARVDSHTDFSDRVTTRQTVTAIVLPIFPAASGPGPQPIREADEILAAALAASRPAMTGISNQVVRLMPLVV